MGLDASTQSPHSGMWSKVSPASPRDVAREPGAMSHQHVDSTIGGYSPSCSATNDTRAGALARSRCGVTAITPTRSSLMRSEISAGSDEFCDS